MNEPSEAHLIDPSRGRIHSLDVLRGFALLGILVMNIQSFAMIEAAYFNPTAYGRLDGVHWWVWYFSRLLVDMKFMAIFSMLFGASALMIVERAKARGERPFFVFARRNLALLVIGFLHGQYLWHGDILYHYALCAFLIYPFRNRRPRTLLLVGTFVLAVGSGLWLAAGLSADGWPDEAMAEHESDWQPDQEIVDEELSAYRGSWFDQNHHRNPTATAMQTMVFLFYFVWRGSGMMLIGMALFKLGVLTGQRSRRFYLLLVLAGVVIGLPLVHWSVVATEASGWDPMVGFFLATQYNYWGSVPVALGWVGAVLLFCRSSVWLARLRPLGAVGRMAFTNYLMQTLLCTTLFYGHGFGLFGKLTRLEQAGVVVAVWIVQLVVSPWWLARFQYGPAEWLWRWATYMRRPPLRVSP